MPPRDYKYIEQDTEDEKKEVGTFDTAVALKTSIADDLDSHRLTVAYLFAGVAHAILWASFVGITVTAGTLTTTTVTLSVTQFFNNATMDHLAMKATAPVPGLVAFMPYVAIVTVFLLTMAIYAVGWMWQPEVYYSGKKRAITPARFKASELKGNEDVSKDDSNYGVEVAAVQDHVLIVVEIVAVPMLSIIYSTLVNRDLTNMLGLVGLQVCLFAFIHVASIMTEWSYIFLVEMHNNPAFVGAVARMRENLNMWFFAGMVFIVLGTASSISTCVLVYEISLVPGSFQMYSVGAGLIAAYVLVRTVFGMMMMLALARSLSDNSDTRKKITYVEIRAYRDWSYWLHLLFHFLLTGVSFSAVYLYYYGQVQKQTYT